MAALATPTSSSSHHHSSSGNNTAAAVAAVRRAKHKQVEIRRRAKLSLLFRDLATELAAGPCDRATILHLALLKIREHKLCGGSGIGNGGREANGFESNTASGGNSSSTSAASSPKMSASNATTPHNNTVPIPDMSVYTQAAYYLTSAENSENHVTPHPQHQPPAVNKKRGKAAAAASHHGHNTRSSNGVGSERASKRRRRTSRKHESEEEEEEDEEQEPEVDDDEDEDEQLEYGMSGSGAEGGLENVDSSTSLSSASTHAIDHSLDSNTHPHLIYTH